MKNNLVLSSNKQSLADDCCNIFLEERTLAEVEKTRSALQDAYFNVEKNKIEIKMKERELEKCEDELDAELLQLELTEKQAGLVTSENHMQAALRKMNFFEIRENVSSSSRSWL